jgi:hypothetical protein
MAFTPHELKNGAIKAHAAATLRVPQIKSLCEADYLESP